MRISWKKEMAALACGLLAGSAWEAAHAGVVVPVAPAIVGQAIVGQAAAGPSHRP